MLTLPTATVLNMYYFNSLKTRRSYEKEVVYKEREQKSKFKATRWPSSLQQSGLIYCNTVSKGIQVPPSGITTRNNIRLL